jgi:hypothetical protein
VPVMPQFALRYFQPPSSNSSVKTCKQTNKQASKQTNKQASKLPAVTAALAAVPAAAASASVVVSQSNSVSQASLRRCNVPVCLCVFVKCAHMRVRVCVHVCPYLKFFELDRDVASLHKESPRLGLLHEALLNSMQHVATLVAACNGTPARKHRREAIRCNATCHTRPPHAGWQPRVTRE